MPSPGMGPLLALVTEIQLSVKSKNDELASQAASELSKVVQSLQSEAPTRSELYRVNVILKGGLMLLYQKCTNLTLEFTSRLLEYTLSLERATLEGELRLLWNAIPGSISTGILDFLEVDKKSHARTLVANHFYGIICQYYFSDSSASQSVLKRSKPMTLTAIFQLLSDSVVGHPENQSKLRHSTSLGGHRIGFILAKLQDYLPIEALLELFANLLPSAKAAGGQGKRTQFIKQVFNASDFCNYPDIAEILASPVSDWTVTSQKICDSLASVKPHFPQPFLTKQVVVGSSQVYPVERIYVDGSGFLASFDEEDSLSTLQLLYRQLKQISISKLSKDTVAVTLVSKVPPVKNQEILPHPLSQDEGHCKCSWELKASDVEKMMQALKHRKLDHLLNAASRKMSLSAMGVELLNIHPPLPSQVKAKEISSLWSKVDPQETSPLLPKSAPSLASVIATPENVTANSRPGKASSIVVAAHASALPKSSKIPTTGPVVNDEEPLPELTDTDSGPESSPSQIMRKVTRKNRQVLTITSDVDPESPVKRPLKLEAKRSKPLVKTEIPLKPVLVQTPGQTKGKETTTVQATRQTRAAAARALAEIYAEPPVDYGSRTRKHKIEDDETHDGGQVPRESKSDIPLAKRPRLRDETEERTRIPPAREQPTRPKSRPVRKHRVNPSASSPPSMQPDVDVHQDKLQAASKTTVTRMKGKNGKNVTIKPKLAKPPPAKKGPKLRDIIPVSSDGEGQHQKQVLRRSPRINKPDTQPESKGRLGEPRRLEQKRPQKTKKAPWDRPSFAAQVELSKSEGDASSLQISEPADNPFPEVDVHMWEASFPRPIYRSPTPIDKPREDAEMIDLTQGSPLPKNDQTKSVLSITGPARRASRVQVEGERQVTGARGYSLVNTVQAPHPTSAGATKAIQTKTMVDMGVQVDVEGQAPVTPVPHVIRKSPTVTRQPVTSTKPAPKVPILPVQQKKDPAIYVISTPASKPRVERSPLLLVKPPTVPRMQQKLPQTVSPERESSIRRRAPERINRTIIDVLNEINDVILGKIESRFEGVCDDMKTSQKSLLDATSEKLSELQSRHTEQYNVLVELFEKYATDRRGNLQLFDEMKRASQEVVDGVTEILLKHNRQSLSKKFPKSLFASVPHILKDRKSLSK